MDGVVGFEASYTKQLIFNTVATELHMSDYIEIEFTIQLWKKYIALKPKKTLDPICQERFLKLHYFLFGKDRTLVSSLRL